jgi:hypothetical protein
LDIQASETKKVTIFLATTIGVCALLGVSAFLTTTSSTRPYIAGVTGPLGSGPGEFWTLAFYGSPPSSLSALESEWSSYFAESDFQTYQQEFGWNLIRLGFCFSDICTSSGALDAHSTSGVDPDLSWLSAVISIAHAHGMEVSLCDFTFTGNPPLANMTIWYDDWKSLATYFSGNGDIAVYQFANELEHSNTTNIVLQTVMSDIRAVDPGRRLAVWQNSFSTPSGTASYPNAPEFVVPPDVYLDYHVATYLSPTTCGTDSDMLSDYESWQNFSMKYGLPTFVGEIDAIYPQCNQTTEYLLNLLMAHNVPFIVWGFSQYRSNWDSIFNSLESASQRVSALPSSTTSGTAMVILNTRINVSFKTTALVTSIAED